MLHLHNEKRIEELGCRYVFLMIFLIIGDEWQSNNEDTMIFCSQAVSISIVSSFIFFP